MKIKKIIPYIALIAFNLVFVSLLAFAGYSYLERTAVDGLNNRFLWNDTDDCSWVLYAQKTAEVGKAPRVAWFDNFGEGRNIGWSPTLMHILSLNGKLFSLFTGKSVHESIEIGAAFINPFLYFILGSAVSIFLWKILGWMGLLVYAFWFFNPIIVGQFSPLHPDHQSVILILNLFSLSAFTYGVLVKSGKFIALAILLGSLNVVVSATTGIFCLVFASVISVAFVFIEKGEKGYLSKGWAIGGVLGGCTSFVFWLFERGNFDLFAFESNNPLHSLSILGASLLVSSFVDFYSNRNLAKGKIIIGIFSIIPMIMTIFVMGHYFVQTKDPVFARLMWRILEMKPQINPSWIDYIVILTIFSIGIKIFLDKKSTTVGLSVILCAMSISLIFLGIRFEATALTISILISSSLVLKSIPMEKARYFIGLFVFAAAFNMNQSFVFWNGVKKGSIMPYGTNNGLVASEIAREIKNDGGTPVVLDSMIDRAIRGFYFLGKGYVGATIYWESIPGINMASSILANANLEIAKENLMKKQVTHVVISSEQELGTLILGSLGGDAEMQATMSNFKGYSVAEWLKDRPDWFKETSSKWVQKIEWDNHDKQE